MAKSQLTINVNVHLEPLFQLKRFSEKNRPVLLKTAAEHLLRWLRDRHEAGANWEALNEATIKRKIRRGVAENPEAILRETDSLMNTLSIRTRGDKVFVGFPRDRSHERTADRLGQPINVNELVRIHSNGGVFLPIREVLGVPPEAEQVKMAELVRKEYDKVIRKINRDNKRGNS